MDTNAHYKASLVNLIPKRSFSADFRKEAFLSREDVGIGTLISEPHWYAAAKLREKSVPHYIGKR